MPPSPQKQPLVKGLSSWQEREQDRFWKLLSKSVPATVVSVEQNCSIVTVKVSIQGFTFPQVRCPVGTPEWVRFPIRPGDMGAMLSADYYIGGMSGIGGGTATLSQMANLSNGIFFPIGNTSFEPSDNPNALLLSGPDGVVIRDRGNDGPGVNGSSVRITVDSSGNVQIWGAKSVSTDVHGYGSRTTWEGGDVWRVDNYVTGATVNTNNLPINPPRIPTP